MPTVQRHALSLQSSCLDTAQLHTARMVVHLLNFFLGHSPRIQLDLLHLDTAPDVRARQEADKKRNDARAKESHFSEGDQVFARNYSGRLRLKAGIVLRRTKPMCYDVQVGQEVEHRHAVQLRPRLLDMPDKSNEEKINQEINQEFEQRQQQPKLQITGNRLANKQISHK